MEVWKAIPGYEGRYEVGSLGKIRSLPRVRVCKTRHKDTTHTRFYAGRELSVYKMRDGHLMTMLGRKNHMLVHRAVALAFIGPQPDGMEVLHLNGIPDDNRVENLKWGTRSENLKMDYAAGVRVFGAEIAKAFADGRRERIERYATLKASKND